VGIGTTTQTSPLAVNGEVFATFFTTASTTATSTFAGSVNIGGGNLFYNASTTVTSISSLELGNLAFDADAGIISWVNLPVTTASATGTVQSYSAQIGDISILTVYGEADGQTSITNARVGIGTTTPTATLSVVGSGTSTPFSVASSTGASLFSILANGNIGIGTSTPSQLLSVAGGLRLTGGFFDGANASGTLGMVLQTTGTSTQWVATSSLGITGGAGVTRIIRILYTMVISDNPWHIDSL